VPFRCPLVPLPPQSNAVCERFPNGVRHRRWTLAQQICEPPMTVPSTLPGHVLCTQKTIELLLFDHGMFTCGTREGVHRNPQVFRIAELA